MTTPYSITSDNIIRVSSLPFIWLVRYRAADVTVSAVMDDFGNLVKIDFNAWAVAVANGSH